VIGRVEGTTFAGEICSGERISFPKKPFRGLPNMFHWNIGDDRPAGWPAESLKQETA
jgi:hypothetical protein